MSTAEVLAGVDIVALRLGEEGELQLLLIRRAQAPFAEQWALPGVLVNGRRVNIPSYQVRPGDVVEVAEKAKSQLRV